MLFFLDKRLSFFLFFGSMGWGSCTLIFFLVTTHYSLLKKKLLPILICMWIEWGVVWKKIRSIFFLNFNVQVKKIEKSYYILFLAGLLLFIFWRQYYPIFFFYSLIVSMNKMADWYNTVPQFLQNIMSWCGSYRIMLFSQLLHVYDVIFWKFFSFT